MVHLHLLYKIKQKFIKIRLAYQTFCGCIQDNTYGLLMIYIHCPVLRY